MYPSNFIAKLKIVTNSVQTMELKQLMLLKIVTKNSKIAGLNFVRYIGLY